MPHRPLLPLQSQHLLAPINPKRVKSREQKGRPPLSYLEAWDIRVHLNRFFGITGWSLINSDVACLFEDSYTSSDGVPMLTVTYKATATLTIHRLGMDAFMANDVVYSETAIDSMSGNSKTRPDLHDNAAKSAQSGALKRCAVNLGDQFGLSLYNHGSTSPVVRGTLLDPPPENEKDETPDKSDEAPPQGPGQQEGEAA